MKKGLFSLTLLLCLKTSALLAQPKFTLSSTGASITKGTINTEILMGIIEQKQEELKLRVFRNIVVNNFTYGDPSTTNFTTYYYIYNLMNTITTEKNKTIITQNLIRRSAEFALVYGMLRFGIDNGLTKYAQGTTFYGNLNLLFPSDTIPVFSSANKFKVESIRSMPAGAENSERGTAVGKVDPFKGKVFNFLIDMTFDAVINDNTVKGKNIFKDDFNGAELSVWYNADNEYQKIVNEGGERATAALAIRAEMDKVVAGYMTNYDNYKKLKEFIQKLTADEKNLAEMSKEEYLAMRSLIKDAVEIIRLNYDNSVVSKISDFVMEYTLIEEGDKSISVDIESLVSALDKHYNSRSRRSSMSSRFWFINAKPFFSMGINYGSFFNQNNLAKDEQGNAQNLQNLYFASEKLGLKIKFFDRKYTRSFGPGEKFIYKGTERVWLRPQDEKLISDAHLIVYGSGLLYNIVNLKSEGNFNAAIVGSSLGITFFNGLSVNAGIANAITTTKIDGKNSYFNFGVDIPILDYINALAKKL